MSEGLKQYLPAEPPIGWLQLPEDQNPFKTFELGAIYFQVVYKLTLIVTMIESGIHASISCSSIGKMSLPDDVAEATLALFFPNLKFIEAKVIDEARDVGKELAREVVGDAIDQVTIPTSRHFIALV